MNTNLYSLYALVLKGGWKVQNRIEDEYQITFIAVPPHLQGCNLNEQSCAWSQFILDKP